MNPTRCRCANHCVCDHDAGNRAANAVILLALALIIFGWGFLVGWLVMR